MKKLGFILVMLSMLILACSDDQQGEGGVELISYGSEYDSLTAAIENDISNPALYQTRAYWLHDQNRTDEALADINRSIALDSIEGQYYVDKANFLIDQKEIGKAKAFLDEAIQITPGSTEIMLKISEIYLWSGDYQRTINWANAALGFDRFLAQAYYLKGMAHEYSNDTVKAVTSFQTAIEQDPNDYNSYMQLGKLYAVEKHEFAEAYFTNAIGVQPESIEAFYARGLYRQSVGEAEKALADYEQIIELEPNHVAANYNIGFVRLMLLEQPDSASAYFEKAYAMEEEYVDALYMLGYCQELQSEYEAALKNYRAVLVKSESHTLAAKGVNRLEK